jgi:hypothetical protein
MLSPFEALPESYRPSAYIVGGYAVNRELAQDIDLWVLVGHGEDASDFVSNFLAHAREGADFQNLTIYNATERAEAYASCPLAHVVIGKVALIEDPRFHKPVQVCLVVGTDDIEDALEGFDLSVHMRAVDSLGRKYAHPLATFPAAPIRVVKANTPVTTLARLERLAARYGTPVLSEELMKLQVAALDKALTEAA